MLNISPKHISAPKSEMYHRERNSGRYEGSAAKCCKNDTMHSEPYVTMKIIEMI